MNLFKLFIPSSEKKQWKEKLNAISKLKHFPEYYKSLFGDKEINLKRFNKFKYDFSVLDKYFRFADKIKDSKFNLIYDLIKNHELEIFKIKNNLYYVGFDEGEELIFVDKDFKFFTYNNEKILLNNAEQLDLSNLIVEKKLDFYTKLDKIKKLIENQYVGGFRQNGNLHIRLENSNIVTFNETFDILRYKDKVYVYGYIYAKIFVKLISDKMHSIKDEKTVNDPLVTKYNKYKENIAKRKEDISKMDKNDPNRKGLMNELTILIKKANKLKKRIK